MDELGFAFVVWPTTANYFCLTQFSSTGAFKLPRRLCGPLIRLDHDLNVHSLTRRWGARGKRSDRRIA